MDVGKQFEFHYDNTYSSDYSTMLRCTGNYGNIVDLPSASGTLALLTDNVASAAKLQNSRTIWGQSFDGTGNVSGGMEYVHYIGMSNSTPYIDFHYGFSTVGYTSRIIEGLSGQLTVMGKLRVGLDYTTSTDYAFHVVGAGYYTGNLIAAGDLTAGSDIRYKDKIQDLRLSVHDIALAPAFTYKWNNREDDALVHIGSSAQYWLNTDAKDAVYYDKQNDFFHLNYASLALCNTIILARSMETQEKKIARLEERIKELEDKLRRYDSCR